MALLDLLRDSGRLCFQIVDDGPPPVAPPGHDAGKGAEAHPTLDHASSDDPTLDHASGHSFEAFVDSLLSPLRDKARRPPHP